MESLIAASESFYNKSKEEVVNLELFNSFMKKITVWDYSCITREHYLSLAIHEKGAMVKKTTLIWKVEHMVRCIHFFIEVGLLRWYVYS